MDPAELKRLRQELGDVTNRGLVAGLLGMPVDVSNQALGLLGMRHPQPVGGSDWIGAQMQRAGLLGGYRNPQAEEALSLFASLPIGSTKLLPGLK